MISSGHLTQGPELNATQELSALAAEAAASGFTRLVVGAAIVWGADVLLLRRPESDFMGGLLELPSGEVESGEDIRTALGREVAEETGLRIARIAAVLPSFDYETGSGVRTRQLNAAVEPVAKGPVVLTEHSSYEWAPLAEIGERDVSEAVQRVLAALRH